MSNLTLHDALRGVPPLDWTVRPNAKDEQRAKARELRAQGMDYEEIATALGVAKSSVSLWVRDLPRPDRLSYAECRKRSAEGAQRYWAAERGVREARRTVRENVGEDYHGCLRIDVRRSSGLYRQIEGWAEAIMSAR